MTIRIIHGDARRLPLDDATVDLIVTSPPYFGLRSYQDNGEHYDGQIGSEPTPVEFIDALIECTREWVRVLKPTGSIWVNLGDKYAGSSAPSRHGQGATGLQDFGAKTTRIGVGDRRIRRTTDVRPKSLLGIPWRYALRCIDDLGLILRAEVIWSKPNGLPESVTDRVRRSHEQWFHFTREPRYFSAVDEIREGYAPASLERFKTPLVPRTSARGMPGETRDEFQPSAGASPLGKLPGSVWTIATEPLRVPDHLGIDHFAAFPTEWPRRIIQGWSPREVCTACGEGRRPVVASVGLACACPDTTAPTTPGIVLDPFGGTGTTALVADVLGRHGITVDLSRDYCRLAEWRTSDPGQRAKAARVEPPPPVLDGQLALFEEPA